MGDLRSRREVAIPRRRAGKSGEVGKTNRVDFPIAVQQGLQGEFIEHQHHDRCFDVDLTALTVRRGTDISAGG